MFYEMYPEACAVAIIRDGYANCQGWMRRGHSPAGFGKLYRRHCETVLEHAERFPRYRIIRFEDLVTDFVNQSESLFHFAGLTPEKLDKFRMKSKRVTGADGSHDATLGSAGAKYWLSHEQLVDFLDPGIDRNQLSQLSSSDVRALESEAGEILERFGYRERYERFREESAAFSSGASRIRP
jgi:hypothetical protein